MPNEEMELPPSEEDWYEAYRKNDFMIPRNAFGDERCAADATLIAHKRQLSSAMKRIGELEQLIDLHVEQKDALNADKEIFKARAEAAEAKLATLTDQLHQVDDVLVDDFIVTENGDYKTALLKMCQFHSELALDPSVSKEMADKLATVREETLREAAGVCRYSDELIANYDSAIEVCRTAILSRIPHE